MASYRVAQVTGWVATRDRDGFELALIVYLDGQPCDAVVAEISQQDVDHASARPPASGDRFWNALSRVAGQTVERRARRGEIPGLSADGPRIQPSYLSAVALSATGEALPTDETVHAFDID